MRRVVLLFFLVGCGGPPSVAPASSGSDLFAGREERLDVQTLPGVPRDWPVPAVFAGGRYLIPYVGSTGELDVRMVATGTAPQDVVLGGGNLVGATARGTGFAVARAVSTHVLVWFSDADPIETVAPGDWIAPSLVSDGARVLVVAGRLTMPGSHVAEVSAFVAGPGSGAWRVLGDAAALGRVFGDAQGFVVGDWMLGPANAPSWLGRVPAVPWPNARLFVHEPLLTTDGLHWLSHRAPLAGAQSPSALDPEVRLFTADEMLTATPELKVSAVRAIPRASGATGFGLVGVAAGRALYEAVFGESDHSFAVLDGETLAPLGVWAKVRATSRQVVVVLGEHDLLLVWMDGAECHYAIWPR